MRAAFPMYRHDRVVAACLGGVAVSLLLVGVISGTFIRHVIQVVPALVVLAAVAKRRAWGPFVATPIFAWWLFIMVLIWLYVAGVPMFFTGSFSVAEIMLTVFIGLSCGFGLLSSVRAQPTVGIVGRVSALAAFGVLQLVCMFVSFLPPFANR